jgi:hypothetical protein
MAIVLSIFGPEPLMLCALLDWGREMVRCKATGRGFLSKVTSSQVVLLGGAMILKIMV